MSKDENNHKELAGCLMLDMSKKITNWGDLMKRIEPSDIYDDASKSYGVEKNPHITILFGFDDNVTGEDVQDLFENVKQNIKFKLLGLSIFETPEFDVVKFTVESEDLLKVHDLVAELPNHQTFPDYKPHMTLAYVKKGRGKRYIKELKKPFLMEGNKLKFTSKGPKKITTEWKIKKQYKYSVELDETQEIVYTKNIK